MAESNKSYANLLYQVAVPSPLRKVFDYLPKKPDRLISPGSRVIVPFGNRTVVGFVISTSFTSQIAPHRLKSIKDILDDEPILPKELLSILKWSSQYYHHPIGQVLATAVPKKIRGANPIKPMIRIWKSLEFLPAEKLKLVENTPRQKALFDLLQQNWLPKADIKNAGFSNSVIKELEKKKLIVESTEPDFKRRSFTAIPQKNPKAMLLNKDQKSALAAINRSENNFQCFLLYGVTGSGKTEVYMQAMQKQLAKGRQCLILVPEIGLTPQTLSRLTERFECPIRTLHSGLSDSERLDSWNMAREGQAGILIGTRSSVFSPFSDLGIIIVDEEHDSSFKQQEGFKYSARDLAILRAKKGSIPIILGSATPSLETLQNVHAKKYKQLSLLKTAADTPLPSRLLIDTSKQRLIHGLSETLLAKIKKHLDAKKQVLVFINRRGFAPALSCQNCGWVAECNNCMSQKTVHIHPPSICCHHCGDVSPLPKKCPICNLSKLETLGVGTQKLETFLKDHFKGTPVFRIDRDSTRHKNQLNEMLAQIAIGESCLMIGTQMIAKGHHFPNITLVAVINADTGLFSPDFRGQEYMAQTITQVSGRTGRANQEGEVIIQTRHASHIALQNLMRGGYNESARIILEERKNGKMPPFCRLAIIKANSRALPASIKFLVNCGAFIQDINQKYPQKVESIGPFPSPLEKRSGKFRAQLLLKSNTQATLQRLLAELVKKLEKIKTAPGLQWHLDVDPVDLT